PEVQAALRKLVRALPEPFRPDAQAASTAVLVDPMGWDRPVAPRRPPTYLGDLQQAVIQGRQVELGYVARDRASTNRVVHPLGLAAKGPSWYLVAGTDAGLRTFRVDRVTSVEATGAPVVRPEGFNLAEAWRLITEGVDQLRAPVRASALAAPQVVAWCRAVLGTRMSIGPGRADGRVELELRGHSPRALAAEIAGFGALVEIVDPPEVRHQLAALAAELSVLYAGRDDQADRIP
ncbi:MAG: helix-turn-helix transcriptional regulator, partial [Acidimicrobiales bacterium]